MGIGSLLGGYLFENYGPRMLFRVVGLVVFTSLCIFTLQYRFCVLPKKKAAAATPSSSSSKRGVQHKEQYEHVQLETITDDEIDGENAKTTIDEAST